MIQIIVKNLGRLKQAHSPKYPLKILRKQILDSAGGGVRTHGGLIHQVLNLTSLAIIITGKLNTLKSPQIQAKPTSTCGKTQKP
jgi:hypothetical protein